MKTVYCVQAYAKKGRNLTAGQFRQFGTADEAKGVGENLSRRMAGVLVYSQRIEPSVDFAEEPKEIARYGEVPSA